MTFNEIYLKGKKILKEAGLIAPAFDTMCIFEFCFNLNRQGIILYGENVAKKEKTSEFFNLIQQRAKGCPLQYILGIWNFMGLKFKVGQGVLIPRDDTEVLVNEALTQIKNIKNPKILDLCAGSGTVAITLAKYRKDAQVVAIELSEAALKYLTENISLNEAKNVMPIKFDVLLGPEEFNFEKFDIIVSNPPYIPTNEIKSLQKEVQNEPKMALDGGLDGLKFYRIIAEKWIDILKDNGTVCMEMGKGQSFDIMNILKNFGLTDIHILKDINNIDRVICARKL